MKPEHKEINIDIVKIIFILIILNFAFVKFLNVSLFSIFYSVPYVGEVLKTFDNVFQNLGFNEKIQSCAFLNPVQSISFLNEGEKIYDKNSNKYLRKLYGCLATTAEKYDDNLPEEVKLKIKDKEICFEITGGSKTCYRKNSNQLKKELNSCIYKTETFISFKNGISKWECFLIFGLLPYLILFLFFKDILFFTPLSERTKNLIAFFAALISILNGMFSYFVWQLTLFTGLAVGVNFLITIFVMSSITALLKSITTWINSMNQAREEVKEYAKAVAQKEIEDIILEMNKQ